MMSNQIDRATNPLTAKSAISQVETAIICLDSDDARVSFNERRDVLAQEKSLYVCSNPSDVTISYLAVVDGAVVMRHDYFIDLADYEREKENFICFVFSQALSKSMEQFGQRAVGSG